MNSMRLLILLTFILYETHRAESTLTYLKSLLKTHLHTTPESPTPIEGCEFVEDDVNDDRVTKWNRQLTLNEKPTIVEIDDQRNFRNVNAEKDPKQHENPIIVEIDDNGSVRSINPDELSVQNENLILIEIDDEGNVHSYNAGETSNENENPIIVEIDDKGKAVRVITKTNPDKQIQIEDEKTGENTSQEQTEDDGGIHGTLLSIKEKIIDKINAIKSKLQLKKEPAEKPVTENVIDSEFLFEGEKNYILPSGAIIPVSTADPVVVVKPVATRKPYVAVSSTTTGRPVTVGSPVTAGRPYTTGIPFAAGIPNGYALNVNVNGDSGHQEQVVNTPDQRRIVPSPVRNMYYSPLPYPLRYGQQYVPVVQNTFVTRPQTIENTPYYVGSAGYRNKNFDYGTNYVQAGRPAASPTRPGQWVRYAYDGSNYVVYPNFPAAPSAYAPRTSAEPEAPPSTTGYNPGAGSGVPFAYAYDGSKYVVYPNYPAAPSAYAPRTSAEPEVPLSTTGYNPTAGSGPVTNSSPTARPIVVYSADDAGVSQPSPPVQEAVSATDVARQTEQDDWNRLVQENASVLTGVEGSDYPPRGDIPYAGDNGASVKYELPEGTETGYLMKERRRAEAVPTTKTVSSQDAPASKGAEIKTPVETEAPAAQSQAKSVNPSTEEKPEDPKSA